LRILPYEMLKANGVYDALEKIYSDGGSQFGEPCPWDPRDGEEVEETRLGENT
jgi:hypothetical protein